MYSLIKKLSLKVQGGKTKLRYSYIWFEKIFKVYSEKMKIEQQYTLNILSMLCILRFGIFLEF